VARLPFGHLPNAWLLLALVLQVLSYPFLADYRGGRAAIAGFDLAILALALRASRAGGHETWLGYVLVVPAMVPGGGLVASPVESRSPHGADRARARSSSRARGEIGRPRKSSTTRCDGRSRPKRYRRSDIHAYQVGSPSV
jgi:hypothetical protein